MSDLGAQICTNLEVKYRFAVAIVGKNCVVRRIRGDSHEQIFNARRRIREGRKLRRVRAREARMF